MCFLYSSDVQLYMQYSHCLVIPQKRHKQMLTILHILHAYIETTVQHVGVTHFGRKEMFSRMHKLCCQLNVMLLPLGDFYWHEGKFCHWWRKTLQVLFVLDTAQWRTQKDWKKQRKNVSKRVISVRSVVLVTLNSKLLECLNGCATHSCSRWNLVHMLVE